MWAHKAWAGRFVPRSAAAGERLRAYAGWCNAVEGNTTFYATPARDTVATWARQTDPGFRFLVKLPKVVTHERRLTGVETEMRAFLDAMQPLGDRAILWTQLPASFGPSDVDTLGRFLRRLPVGLRRAVEVRHPGFYTDAQSTSVLERTLTAVSTEWVPFDTTVFFQRPPTSEIERETWTMKPRLPRRTRALTDRPIVRYLGRDSVEETVQGWGPWTEVVAEWLRAGRAPTVFVHTPDNDDAPALARRFHEDVRALVPGLDPLPEPEPVEPATLF
ncbi:DUF72 domain-containing protein [Amycolatopsis regifaucium]|uniref:DUF72 domain-containing protein n=1 Tax=Amycolatopsis regifaucium TaxID=546365 RepID=A0A154MCX6_9PSEU|nr:DUF72 domain-containing protein [Amycolatopsis regifaucium]KZB81519.1 hypothetical protein AVL48_05805 [Amycolatopsis regifaucium]OKA06912.1 hypothetical protein ATP06_0220495 [Amycolatopsis regifaucium]SFH29419.1 Uncharacterized conserved protein YecE, DUF72 family [Amycolatopsis regifaucium]